jgi:hypothetical protein
MIPILKSARKDGVVGGGEEESREHLISIINK